MENIIDQIKDYAVTDLIALSAEIKKLIDAKTTPSVARAKFGGYNARRYSRPWIAKVVAWERGASPSLEFGAYYGDDSGGIVEIAANEGDIIRYGQRDNRGNNTENYWGVFSNGEIVDVTAAKARDLFNK